MVRALRGVSRPQSRGRLFLFLPWLASAPISRLEILPGECIKMRWVSELIS